MYLHPSRFVSYLHPCNEFTIGYVKPNKLSDKEKQYDRDDAAQWERHSWEQMNWWGKIEKGSISLLLYDKILDPWRFDPLGLSKVNICHRAEVPENKRIKRGSKGMTKKAARLIRDSACILEHRHKGKLGFYTFTLPSLSKEILKDFISKKGGWSRLVRIFIQSLKRRILKAGGDPSIVGCSEIQAKRYRRRKEIAPHLHLVFKAFDKKYQWYLSAQELRAIWIRALCGHLDRLGYESVPIDVRAGVDCQIVKKSAANYLGKYISKGGAIIKEIAKKEGEEFVCSNWSHISDSLRRFTKTQIKPLHPGEMNAIMNQEIDLVARGYLEYLFPIWITVGDQQLLAGYSGKKKTDLYQLNHKEYDYAT